MRCLNAVSLFGWVALLSAGCQTDPPAPDVSGRAAMMTAISAPIEFQQFGEPLDVGTLAEEVLRLDEAIQQALSHSPDVQAALARVRAALADARQVRLLPNPVLSVVIRFPEGGGKAIIDASLAGDIISLLGRPRRIAAADKRLAAAAAEALTVVLDRLAEVQVQYAAVQALDARLRVLEEQQRLIDRLLQIARSRVEAGESSRLDVLALDTERIRVEVEVLDVEAQRRDHRLVLTRLLGRPSGQTDWQLQRWQPPVPLPVDEKQWITVALQNRPEVQARRWEVAALGDDAALARLALFDGAEVGLDAERDENWSAGPAISTPLPLFDWGQARRDKADAERIEARHRLVQTQRQIIEDVRRALAGLTLSQQSLSKVRDELIPNLERRHEQASDAYQAGLLSITDVLLAEKDLQEARGRLVELQQQVSEAQSRLHRAVGGPAIASAPSTSGQPNQNNVEDR